MNFIPSSFFPVHPDYNAPQTLKIDRSEEFCTTLVSRYIWPLEEACEVMFCESGGNPDAVGDKATQYHSYGLFQIRALPGRPSPEWLLDPENNVAYAYSLYKEQGWKPWTCAK